MSPRPTENTERRTFDRNNGAICITQISDDDSNGNGNDWEYTFIRLVSIGLTETINGFSRVLLHCTPWLGLCHYHNRKYPFQLSRRYRRRFFRRLKLRWCVEEVWIYFQSGIGSNLSAEALMTQLIQQPARTRIPYWHVMSFGFYNNKDTHHSEC